MTAWFDKSPDNLDEPIERLLEEMALYSPDTPEYQNALNNMERLTELQLKKRPARVSRDVIAGGLFTLANVVVIVAYEQKHVVTSKALTLLNRPRS